MRLYGTFRSGGMRPDQYFTLRYISIVMYTHERKYESSPLGYFQNYMERHIKEYYNFTMKNDKG